MATVLRCAGVNVWVMPTTPPAVHVITANGIFVDPSSTVAEVVETCLAMRELAREAKP